MQVILVHADQQFLDKVFGALELDNETLCLVARSVDVACAPQGFTYLLGKIDNSKSHGWAIRNGVSALFEANRTEYIDPLLSAIEEGSFLTKDLGGIAISIVFLQASHYQDYRTLFAEQFFDHPAVSAKGYFMALEWSYHVGGLANDLFHWLLNRADGQDLETVKSHSKLYTQKPEFRDAVTRALKDVNLKSNRREEGRKRQIKTLGEAIECFPDVLLEIIFDYNPLPW